MKTMLLSGFMLCASIFSFAQFNAGRDAIVFEGNALPEKTFGWYYYTPDGVVHRIPASVTDELTGKAPNPLLTAGQSFLIYSKFFVENPGIYVINVKTGGDLCVSRAGQEECRVLAVSPSQKKILYVAKRDGVVFVCAVNIDGSDHREAFLVEGADSPWSVSGCFANESDIVYWMSNPLMVWRGNLDSRTNAVLVDSNGRDVFLSTNLNPAKILLYSSNVAQTYVIDLAQIRVTPSRYLPFLRYQHVWLENGSSALYAKPGNANENRYELRLYDTRTGNDTAVTSLAAAYCSLMGPVGNGTQCLFNSIAPTTYEGKIFCFDVNTKSIRNLSAEYSVITFGGKACPFLFAGAAAGVLQPLGEVLENINRKELERLEKKPLSPALWRDGVVRIRIEENRYETTRIDGIGLRVDGKLYAPQDCPEPLLRIDERYLVLERGDSIELEFRVPQGHDMVLETAGYYQPLWER